MADTYLTYRQECYQAFRCTWTSSITTLEDLKGGGQAQKVGGATGINLSRTTSIQLPQGKVKDMHNAKKKFKQ